MSDPVSNVEDVEDVLSSIRRLVSETSGEARAAADDAPAEETTAHADGDETAEDAPAAPVNDALILTSALRIKDAEPVTTPEGPVATELESLRKAVSGAFDQPDEAAAEDAGETQPPFSIVDEQADPNEQADAETAEGETAEGDTVAKWPPTTPPEDYYEDEVTADTIPFLRQSAANSEKWDLEEENPSEEDEAMVTDEPEADAPWINVSDYEVAEDAADDAGDQQEEDLATEMAAALAEDDAPAEQDDAPEMTDVAEEDISTAQEPAIEEEVMDEVPAMATFIRSSQDDGPAEDATAETSPEVAAELAEFVDSDASGDEIMFADNEDDAAEQEPVDLSNLNDVPLDEDTLRDMVAEIVRQELTGAMGERITRNVRKLVRREIHRALASREFD